MAKSNSWGSPAGRTGRRTIDQIMDKNNKKSSDSSGGSSSDSGGSSSSSTAKAKTSKKKKKQEADTTKTYTTAKLVAPKTRHIAPEQYSVSRAGIDLYKTDEKNYVPYVPTGSVSGVGTTTVEDDTIDSADEQDVKGFSLHLGTILDTYHIGNVTSLNFEANYTDMQDSATVNLESVDLKKSYKGVCTKLLTEWDTPNNTLKWEDFYVNGIATHGFITEQTFTENNVELKISGMTKTLDMKYKFNFKQMYRSEIINQVILTAGLIPVLNFDGLDDDITNFKNYSESESKSGSGEGDINIKSTGSSVLDEVVKKAVGSLTEPLAQAKAIDKAFKSHVYYEGYSDVHHPNLEKAWKHAHLNCADGANVLCAMFLAVGLNATICHSPGKGEGHYIVKLDINGQTYYTDNAAASGSHTTRPFGSVYGPKTNDVVGTKIPE